ncbi:unnamed protein product [Miscanthus lutarioriparius]|uniref:Alpha-D-phosphohexomutase alpha/beta/alpha domain-containing protein n=1 Tax=Miscanthus lutarioriparius TaxID=422564 RepID=A0A811NXT1_9POAL|nr:unnamed protein product [Miscanthus lutarioriparius]
MRRAGGGTRGGAPCSWLFFCLTPLPVEVIAESFGEWLREEIRLRGELQEPHQLRVSVGHDPRLSGPRLGAALFAGLTRAGCSVFDMGLATRQAPEV